MRAGYCLGCKRSALLYPDLCAACDPQGGDDDAGIRQED